MVYLAAQQQNKRTQFPVCANIRVLFTLDILSQACEPCEKHIQTRFSLQQFRFWSITQPIMLWHVSVHSGAFCLRSTELGIRFQQPSLIESLYFLILTIYLSYWPRFCSQQQQCLKKHFKNAHCEFNEQFSGRKRMFPIQSIGVECKVCLSHAGGLR